MATTQAFVAAEAHSANLAPGCRIAVVKCTIQNTYDTASNTFSAATYGGFDSIHNVVANSIGAKGYVADCGVSTVTVTPNLYRRAADGSVEITTDTTEMGDTCYSYLLMLGT